LFLSFGPEVGLVLEVVGELVASFAAGFYLVKDVDTLEGELSEQEIVEQHTK
jgi:hypothetical protein